MNLLDLPPEILLMILETYVGSLETYKGLRLRGVNREHSRVEYY